MRKKIVTVLLAVSLTMSLSACGATTSESSTPSPEPAKTESSVEDEATTPEPEVTDETEKEEPEAEDEDESIETTDTDTEAENDSSKSALDMDQCISDLKDNLSLEPDYSFVQDYYIGVKDDQITITAVVDDATDPNVALDFADTLVRQLNLYAQMQDSSIDSASKDFYGGLYKRYSALVGIAPASNQDDPDSWFVYDGIVGGKVMLKLNKAYR